MKYLPFLGCTAALVFFADMAVAKSPAEIEQIARSVSVELLTGGGSGTIVHRQGDLYTLITNRHVVCLKQINCDLATSYDLRTADGQVYQVPKAGVQLLKDSSGAFLDLAIVKFRSSRSYR